MVCPCEPHNWALGSKQDSRPGWPAGPAACPAGPPAPTLAQTQRRSINTRCTLGTGCIFVRRVRCAAFSLKRLLALYSRLGQSEETNTSRAKVNTERQLLPYRN